MTKKIWQISDKNGRPFKQYKHGPSYGEEKICLICKEKFFALTKKGKGIYCSNKCSAALRTNRLNKKGAEHPRWKAIKIEKQKHSCKHCKKEFLRYPTKTSKDYCSNKCRGFYLRGKKHWAWKGGRKRDKGYILVYKPEHHRADRHGYVREHVLVLEEKLGRPILKTENTHHINQIKDDNRPENLTVMSAKEHGKLHQALKLPLVIPQSKC